MSGQVSRGSAGDYKADEQAGIAWLRWRVSSKFDLSSSGAGSWTRTNEGRIREIYSLLPLPLGDSSIRALKPKFKNSTNRMYGSRHPHSIFLDYNKKRSDFNLVYRKSNVSPLY